MATYSCIGDGYHVTHVCIDRLDNRDGALANVDPCVIYNFVVLARMQSVDPAKRFLGTVTAAEARAFDLFAAGYVAGANSRVM